MQKKENEYFEYVAWLEKQPNVIDFAKHYITTRGDENYFNINNKATVEFIASLFAQSYAHEDDYKFDKETEFDKNFTISDIIDKTCLLEHTLFRVKRALNYNDDGTVTVNLWKDLDEAKEFDSIRETIDENL